MKPAPFEYAAPATLAEALALKAQHGDDAKFLAGGQSLVPAMNFRLARPSILVDINDIADLAGISATPEGGLRIGYNWNQGDYGVAVFGRNITDQTRIVGGIDFNNLTGFLNEPRTVGVEFSARF